MQLVERDLAVESELAYDAGDATIVRVTYDKVFVPFHRANYWSAGNRPGTTRLLVQVETADGTIGCGETICLHEFIEPVLARTIIPLSLGEEAFNIERLLRKLEGAGYYHHKRALVAAMAGFEMALWDIVGKKAGLPLYQLWGGAYRREVPMIAYVMASDLDRLVEDATRYVGQGFNTIKLKIGIDEESDIETVRVVREAVGSKVRLRADVNGAWTIGTSALRALSAEEFPADQALPARRGLARRGVESSAGVAPRLRREQLDGGW